MVWASFSLGEALLSVVIASFSRCLVFDNRHNPAVYPFYTKQYNHFRQVGLTFVVDSGVRWATRLI